MKKFVLAFILFAPTILFAQEDSPSVANKAIVCTACHGQQGNSTNPEWPNIAGQHPKYFVKQLKDMKDRSLRDAPTMNALVSTLSAQDMDDLAAYYAKMPVAQGSTPEHFLKRGEQIYRGGDFAKRSRHVSPAMVLKARATPKRVFQFFLANILLILYYN